MEAVRLLPGRGDAAVVSRFRRDAAVLAAYLAQFENTESNCADPHTAATALTPEEHHQRRRDYANSLAWATATQVNDEDIAALTQVRQRYGFPPQS
ncbi:hypothetical protein AS032_33220 [Rhodococcus qingshengii]|nr:hypothetical protein AOT96_32905 [Rhodococcus sp. 008]KSU64849.1 hypothetical protein AS032_33220 [Rhodococcus qingshengii]